MPEFNLVPFRTPEPIRTDSVTVTQIHILSSRTSTDTMNVPKMLRRTWKEFHYEQVRWNSENEHIGTQSSRESKSESRSKPWESPSDAGFPEYMYSNGTEYFFCKGSSSVDSGCVMCRSSIDLSICRYMKVCRIQIRIIPRATHNLVRDSHNSNYRRCGKFQYIRKLGILKISPSYCRITHNWQSAYS